MRPAAAAALGLATIGLAALLHFDALRLLSLMLHRMQGPRRRALAVMLGLALAHLAEIMVFASAYALGHVSGLGRLAGASGTAGDAFYLSAATYTTVGYGDLSPIGALRLVAACEAVAGPLLLGWSVTFLARGRIATLAREHRRR